MGAPQDGSGALLYQYVYASNAHSPDFVVDATGAAYRVITDQLGSPLLIVNVADANDVLLEAEYSAFGARTVLAGDGDALTLGFAGGVFDADTGLTRFGARDYDPVVGRWTAKDPILFAGGQANLYVYVGNDPVNLIDPHGLFVGTAWDVTVQAARGAWTSPQLAVGLLVGALGSGFNASVVNGNLEFYDNGITSGLSAATTFGQVIVYSYPRNQIAPSLRAHEQQHVAQSDVLGPAYLPAHIFNQAFFGFALGFEHHDTPLECGPSNRTNPNPWGF